MNAEIPDLLTYRYHAGSPTGPVRVVRAHSCEVAGGRVTWRDGLDLVVLSEPSDAVHHLACEQAGGSADDRPAYADEIPVCPWCKEWSDRNAGVDELPMGDSGHIPGCPHAPADPMRLTR